LTAGKPALVSIRLADEAAGGAPAALGTPLSEDEVLALAAAVEVKSEQPLARGIVAAANARELALAKVRDFRALPGLGVEGRVGGRAIWIGSPRGASERDNGERDNGGARQRRARRSARGRRSLVEPLEARGESAVIVQIDGGPPRRSASPTNRARRAPPPSARCASWASTCCSSRAIGGQRPNDSAVWSRSSTSRPSSRRSEGPAPL
jgi:hypothetical protein